MNRDDFILSMRPTINNLLRKYHHYGDEDLFQIAMLDVIVGYDRCVNEGILDEAEQRRMCNTYAKYAILNELRKQNKENNFFDIIDDEDIDEPKVMQLDDIELMVAIDEVLDKDDRFFLDLLLSGYNRQEVCTKLFISEKTFYNRKAKIFEKIKNLLQK